MDQKPMCARSSSNGTRTGTESLAKRLSILIGFRVEEDWSSTTTNNTWGKTLRTCDLHFQMLKGCTVDLGVLKSLASRHSSLRAS
eukprot:5153261-Amphidinium_carterae.2